MSPKFSTLTIGACIGIITALQHYARSVGLSAEPRHDSVDSNEPVQSLLSLETLNGVQSVAYYTHRIFKL